MMCTKMVPEEEDRVEKFIRGFPDNIQGNVITAEPTRLQDAVRIANNLIDQKLKGYAMKNAKNKRKFDNSKRDNRGQQPPNKRQNVGGQNVANERRAYNGPLRSATRNKNGVGKARGKAYVLGVDRSFMSTTFSTLLDITPDTLDVSYAVADERISKTNTVLREQITKKETEDKSEEKGLEDVPIIRDFSENEEEHAEHLKLILELLKKEEFYAKFSKCGFWLSKVQFLAHVINNEGIHMDPAKIEPIKDWALPKTQIEIHQFLGLAGYY
ncbi:hypothetical protein Tco_1454369 [Tanacetum coccineum]